MMKSISLLILGAFLGLGAGYLLKGQLDPAPAVDSALSGKNDLQAHSNSDAANSTLQSSQADGKAKPIAPATPAIVPQIAPVATVSETSKALAVLGEARSHREVVAALENLLPRLRSGNPQQIAKSALEMPEGAERDMALMLSLGELAERNPSEALRFAESLPVGEDRDQALRWIAAGLPSGNIERTLALADSVEDSDLRELIVAKVIAKEAESNPASAMNALTMIEDPAIRANALAATAESWVSADPEGALDHAKKSADPAVRSDLLAFLSASAEADSKQVFEVVLDQMPSGMAYQAAISDLFENWAVKDPSAAASALSKIPPGPALDSATSEVASALANSSAPKKEIAAWIGGLPNGSARLEALDGLYSEWARTDPSGALGEAARLTGGDRNAALNSLVNSWAGEDPASVLQWGIRGANGFDEARDLAVQSGIRGIAYVDPAEAARQVGSVPPALQASANSALVEVWSEVDAESAAAWLSSKPKGSAIDGAAGRLAMSLVREDPEMAMEWALAISAPESRTKTAQEVARQWKQRNPDSARAYSSKNSSPSVSAMFAD
jgi:hypothetical protein